MSKKTVFFDDYCGYQMSVIVENGKITEFGFEKKTTFQLSAISTRAGLKAFCPE